MVSLIVSDRGVIEQLNGSGRIFNPFLFKLALPNKDDRFTHV